jgi:hypothetical protein
MSTQTLPMRISVTRSLLTTSRCASGSPRSSGSDLRLGRAGTRGHGVRRGPDVRPAAPAVRQPLCSVQIVQDRLVKLLAEVTGMQLSCMQLARLEQTGRLTDAIAGLAKLNNTCKARQVIADACDLLGGNGVLLENPRHPPHGRHRSHPHLRRHRDHADPDRRARHHRRRSVRLRPRSHAPERSSSHSAMSGQMPSRAREPAIRPMCPPGRSRCVTSSPATMSSSGKVPARGAM